MTDISTQIIADGKVAVVSINRPKKFNALSWKTFADLKEAIENLTKPDLDIRCIVLTGEGKHFTAGLDLTSAMDLSSVKQDGKDPARTAF